MRQHPHNSPVHAPHQHLVVRHHPIVHHARARRLLENGRQPPKGRADHDDLGLAPGHQRREQRPVVSGLALRHQVRREAVAGLHAGEGRGSRQGAQTHGPVSRHAHLGSVHHLLEHVRHGGAIGVRLEEGLIAVWGGRGLDFLDNAEEDLPREGQEEFEFGSFGVELVGAAEEDLVGAAGGVVVAAE